MNQEQLFDNIEQLLDVLATYQRTGHVKVTVEQQILIRDSYRVIYPDVTVQLGCSSCILQYLNMLVAFYEREYPKFANLKSAEAEESKPKKIKKK